MVTSQKLFSSLRCLKEATMFVWKSFQRRQNCWSSVMLSCWLTLKYKYAVLASSTWFWIWGLWLSTTVSFPRWFYLKLFSYLAVGNIEIHVMLQRWERLSHAGQPNGKCNSNFNNTFFKPNITKKICELWQRVKHVKLLTVVCRISILIDPLHGGAQLGRSGQRRNWGSRGGRQHSKTNPRLRTWAVEYTVGHVLLEGGEHADLADEHFHPMDW